MSELDQAGPGTWIQASVMFVGTYQAPNRVQWADGLAYVIFPMARQGEVELLHRTTFYFDIRTQKSNVWRINMATIFSDSYAKQTTGLEESSQASAKQPKVLACALCQRRKVRCDRQNPCQNCVKAGERCTPAMLGRPRRRRLPERILLEHIRHCETLLGNHGIDFEPLHAPAAADPVQRAKENGGQIESRPIISNKTGQFEASTEVPREETEEEIGSLYETK